MSYVNISTLPAVQQILTDAKARILYETGVEVELIIRSYTNAGQSKRDKHKQFLREIICDHFGVAWQQVLNRSRVQVIVEARHAYMYLAHVILKETQTDTAKDCNVMNHTSVVHAVDKINGFYFTRDPYINHIDILKYQLNQYQNETNNDTKIIQKPISSLNARVGASFPARAY